MGKKNESIKIACENRKARHDYFIHETYEAGMELVGTEVKSLRAGRANLRDSYAYIKNGELFLDHMHISPYEQGNQFNHDPLRVRRLLPAADGRAVVGGSRPPMGVRCDLGVISPGRLDGSIGSVVN